jgi:hypothetical protein
METQNIEEKQEPEQSESQESSDQMAETQTSPATSLNETRGAQFILPERIIKIAVEETSSVVFENLEISRQKYPAIAVFIDEELEELLRKTTSLDRVHKICGGNMDTSFAKAKVDSATSAVALKISDMLCDHYQLELRENRGLNIFHERLVGYYARMLSGRFTRRWLGRKLYEH